MCVCVCGRARRARGKPHALPPPRPLCPHHDRDVGEPFPVERGPNGPHPAVHHVGWGDTVRARARLRHRLPAQELDRLVIENRAVVRHDAVVAVDVVRVEGDVRVNLQVGECGAQQADGALHEAVVVEGLLAGARLEVVGGLRGGREERVLAAGAATSWMRRLRQRTWVPSLSFSLPIEWT